MVNDSRATAAERHEDVLIREADPRTSAMVTFNDGRTFDGPLGAPLSAFCAAAYPGPEAAIMAAFVDGEAKELSYAVERDVSVRVIDTRSNDGMRIYQRGLTFLLVVALEELFPEARVFVDHSVTTGGFFCQIRDRAPLTTGELAAVEQRMREIVAADEPIVAEWLPVSEASELFARQGYDDKVRLLEGRVSPVQVYNLRGIRDNFYGLMPARSACLQWFALERYANGFILRMPRRQAPRVLPESRDFPKLMSVFGEYAQRLRVLRTEDIGALNATIAQGAEGQAILVSEALHEKRIAQIADEIARAAPGVRLVLIAGPSASGKTTFARRLSIQLMTNGLQPFPVGLDDYFVDREQTPRDEDGDYDFEALEAIDIPLFNEQLEGLLSGRRVQTRRYDFVTGRNLPGKDVQLSEDAIVIVEGIHGLNPSLVSRIAPAEIYRIYVSALTQLNIDHHNRVPTTDTRLLRRTVRDARYRGYTAQQTIRRWESVRRGEDKYIFPYQENADTMFNSALVYELAVLKPLAEPLLLRVPHGCMEGMEARRLLSFLQWVRPCGADLVPDNSLLREFVGGSNLRE